MKTIVILLLIVLTSCGVSNEIKLPSTTLAANSNPCNDNLSRQERKALKDSMRHVENLAKIEQKVLKDSLNYMRTFIRVDRRKVKDSIRWEYKTKVIEKVRFKDSIRWVTKQIKSDNKKAVKITRIENRSYWWLWMILGGGLVLGVRSLIKVALSYFKNPLS